MQQSVSCNCFNGKDGSSQSSLFRAVSCVCITGIIARQISGKLFRRNSPRRICSHTLPHMQPADTLSMKATPVAPNKTLHSTPVPTHGQSMANPWREDNSSWCIISVTQATIDGGPSRMRITDKRIPCGPPRESLQSFGCGCPIEYTYNNGRLTSKRHVAPALLFQ
jgi:hypothetical protein